MNYHFENIPADTPLQRVDYTNGQYDGEVDGMLDVISIPAGYYPKEEPQVKENNRPFYYGIKKKRGKR